MVLKAGYYHIFHKILIVLLQRADQVSVPCFTVEPILLSLAPQLTNASASQAFGKLDEENATFLLADLSIETSISIANVGVTGIAEREPAVLFKCG